MQSLSKFQLLLFLNEKADHKINMELHGTQKRQNNPDKEKQGWRTFNS